jgi:hypothetical protein
MALMPEIHQFAPHAVYVAHRGEVNAWDHGGRLDERLRDGPGAGGKSSGIQRLRRNGRFGQRE